MTSKTDMPERIWLIMERSRFSHTEWSEWGVSECSAVDPKEVPVLAVTTPGGALAEIKQVGPYLRADIAEKRIAELKQALADYGEHSKRCECSRWCEGRPTKDGGYEHRYGDTWYQGDDMPPCTCVWREALGDDE